MCEHIPDRRHYTDEKPHEKARRLKRQRCQAPLYRCRINCDECASALKAELVGCILAEKETSQRDLFVTLTYSDSELMRLEGNTDAAHDIDATKGHCRAWLQRLRDMLRRLHPELVFQIGYFRVSEYGDEFGRVHHHAILSFYVDWKDYSDCDAVPKAQWTDEFIPHLLFDYRYIHEMETAEEEIARLRAAAKRSGKRFRKPRQSKYPSRIPHPYGFVKYENCRGGDPKYLACYCTKAIDLQVAARKAGWNQSAEEQETSRKAWQSFKSRRRSIGYGRRYVVARAREAARAGLPASTYFTARPRGKVIPGRGLLGGPMVTGSDKRRWIDLHWDDNLGCRVSSERMVRWRELSFMLSGATARVYLDAYDEAFKVFHGHGKKPVGSVIRWRRRVGLRDRQYYAYGVDELRAAKQKQEWAAEDSAFLAKRRRQMKKNRDGTVYLTVREELAARWRDQPVEKRADRLERADRLALPSQKDRDWAALFDVWGVKFYRDNCHRLTGEQWDFQNRPDHRRLSLRWFKEQPALADFPPARIYDLWKAALGIRIPRWSAWPKGEGGNGYAIAAMEHAPPR